MNWKSVEKDRLPMPSEYKRYLLYGKIFPGEYAIGTCGIYGWKISEAQSLQQDFQKDITHYILLEPPQE